MNVSSLLTSLEDYETFIYTIREQFRVVEVSTLLLVRESRTTGRVQGVVTFLGGRVELLVYQAVDTALGQIRRYSYEVRVDGQTVYWYDSQPHPHDPTLAATHPHHKHIPPDIKHHRIPAPGLSFQQPNLPFLIRENRNPTADLRST